MVPDALVREVLSRSTEIPLRIYNLESYDEERGAEVNGWETLVQKWNKLALGSDVVPGMQHENFEAVHV
jgi:hypothetical protein